MMAQGLFVETDWFPWSWDEMCGPGGLSAWSVKYHDIGMCFQELCLQIPVLTLLAAISGYYCGKYSDWVVRSASDIRVLCLRSLAAAFLALTAAVRICVAITISPQTIHPIDYLLAGIEGVTWLVHVGYILALRHRLGISLRGPVIIRVIWMLNYVLCIISFRSHLLLYDGQTTASESAYLSYVFSIIKFILQSMYFLTLVPSERSWDSGTYEEFSERVQSSEHQSLLGSPRFGTYSRFSEEMDPLYLGVAKENAPFCSKLLFHWVTPLMEKGAKRKLKSPDDLYDLPIPLTPAYLCAQLEMALIENPTRQLIVEPDFHSTMNGSVQRDRELIEAPWKTQTERAKVSLLRALHTCFGVQFYSVGILKFVADTAGFMGPLLLQRIVTFVENRDEPFHNGVFYAAGLFLVNLISSLSNAHFNFYMAEVGLKIRGALVTTVYRKTLSLSSISLSVFSMGEIVNFMSTDTERIVNSCPSFHAFWSIPFQDSHFTDRCRHLQLIGPLLLESDVFAVVWVSVVISFGLAVKLDKQSVEIAVTFYLLYNLVGIAFLAGVAFTVILIPINKCIASKIGSLSTKLMNQKDERVKVMAEILCGIRSIKLHVWENHFVSKIGKLRDKELRYLRGRKYLDALCVYFWATTPVLITILTFLVYVLLGNKLTAATVFTCMALLNMLIAPLNAFPWVLNGLTEAWVSLKRIQRLLELSDLEIYNYYTSLPDKSSDLAVFVKEGTFSWGKDTKSEEEQRELQTQSEGTSKPVSTRFVLSNVSFTVAKGQFIGVTGSVGSGKSSLLAALIAELEKEAGVVTLADLDLGFGYVAQQPWLQRATIRDNILFGRTYDHLKYKAVIDACSLEQDINSFPSGDETGIGEGGATLSGGQKARIALARAVYQDKNIYLLDDVMSAVDVNVARHIFHKCINGLLRNKTRILCTHHVQYLLSADNILIIENGKIVQQGKPTDVLPDFEDYLSPSDYDINDSNSSQKVKRKDSKCDPDSLSIGADSILDEETRETGTIGINIYINYLKAVGYVLSTLILVSLVTMQTSKNVTDWWLSYWVSNSAGANKTTNSSALVYSESTTFYQGNSISFYLTVYGVLVGLNTVFTLLRAFLFAYGGIEAASNIHRQLLKTIIKAQVTFFDISPLGRILNRFSSDTYTIDDSLPFIMNILLAQFFGLLGTVVITIYGLPWLVLVLVPLVPVYHWLQHLYRFTSRELKRLSSVTLSPIYSHYNETLQGLSTIRALRAVNRFKRENEEYVEDNQKCRYASQAASQWLGLRLQFIGVAMVTGVGIIALIQHQFNVANPGLIGLAIAYALTVTSMLSGVVNAFTETEQEMIAVERAYQYIEQIEPERTRHIVAPPYAWPSQGVVQFNNVVLRYRDHLSPSLKAVSFTTRPAEKIGVVGRTGAGKSSLFAALFRLVELSGGEITIDTVNIAHIGLTALRSRLAIIPQEPFLFGGTVRENIDPLDEYRDTEIWGALQRCHLAAAVNRLGGLEAKVGQGGQNLSVGQRQLLCLVRAVLHNAKILCIDEATANVDIETDRHIQRTLRTSFLKSTVITIAHRVRTIMDSDRVLVMGDGEVLEYDSPDTLIQNKDSYFYSLAHQEFN